MKRSYVLPIVVMFFLFAMISFVTGFQNPFGVILKEQLTLNNFPVSYTPLRLVGSEMCIRDRVCRPD